MQQLRIIFAIPDSKERRIITILIYSVYVHGLLVWWGGAAIIFS